MASAAYGSLHATAWNGYFVRPLERMYWRASILIVAISGVIKAVSNLLQYLNPPLLSLRSASHYRYADLVRTSPFKLATYFLWFIFVAARYALVFEALASLRKLPVKIYETPSWSQYLPHL